MGGVGRRRRRSSGVVGRGIIKRIELGRMEEVGLLEVTDKGARLGAAGLELGLAN